MNRIEDSFMSILLALLFAAPLTDAEGKAVESCLALIRASQLPDGAFNMKADDKQVWINPYFAHRAALALLAAHERNPDKKDLAAVGRWLEWCAARQRKDGSVNDHTGTRAAYKDNGKRDSVDSYSAFHLLVIERHHRLAGKSSAKVRASAKLAFEAVQGCQAKDGLSFAKPDYRVKYLMDNLETAGGLRAGAAFFRAVGDTERAASATRLAGGIDAKMPLFWQPKDKLYAWAMHDGGEFAKGWAKPYPDAQANLAALAWMPGPAKSRDKGLWRRAQKDFKPDTGPTAAVPADLWLMAASRAGTAADVKRWREATAKEAASLTKENAYVQRAGNAVLALLEQAAWLPRK